MYLCSNWVRTRAARTISVVLLGLAVMRWRAVQRWVSRANPRSPWLRRPRRRLLRVLVSGSRRWFPPGFLTGDVDADSGSFVAAVGQRGHSGGGGPVQEKEGVLADGGDVVDVARFRRPGPGREAAGEHDGLDVRAGAVLAPGVPGVDVLALFAGH